MITRAHTTGQNYNDQKKKALFSTESECDIKTGKFVHVKLIRVNIKLQLDPGSDMSIINVDRWRKIRKPRLDKSGKNCAWHEER